MLTCFLLPEFQFWHYAVERRWSGGGAAASVEAKVEAEVEAEEDAVPVPPNRFSACVLCSRV